MHTLKFIEEETGGEHLFDDFDVLPLGYELLKTMSTAPAGIITIPLVAVNARPLTASGDPMGPRVNIKAAVDTEIGIDVRALLVGGWLPPGLAPHNSILMMDACALSVIRGRYQDGELLDRWKPDFLDMLQDRVPRVTLLPLLVEGKKRGGATTETDLEQTYDEAVDALARALPRVKIEGNRSGAIQGAMGLIADDVALRRREIAFLKSVMPMLGARPASAKLLSHWLKIVDAARNHELLIGAFPVLAALSALVAQPSMNPARRLLKPGPEYSDADAHNALADLNALRLLAAVHGDFPRDKPILLTYDKDLALFWAGLGSKSAEREGAMLHYHLSPHEDLFPGDFGARLIQLVASPRWTIVSHDRTRGNP
ncbi:MAG: hypothetical protein V4684_04700 [Pseudomonadota bacterium]